MPTYMNGFNYGKLIIKTSDDKYIDLGSIQTMNVGREYDYFMIGEPIGSHIKCEFTITPNDKDESPELADVDPTEWENVIRGDVNL